MRNILFCRHSWYYLAILLLAIANFVIGSFIPPTNTERAKGFVGYSGKYNINSCLK